MPAKPSKASSSRNTTASVTPSANRRNAPVPRKANGQFEPGFSGQPGGDAGRARRALNLDTIREMHLAFQRGGRTAIDKVMRNSPSQFLKMLILLVPRELEVTHSGGVRGMTDEQLEGAIATLEALMAKRAAGPGADAKVIEGTVAEDVSASDT